MAQKRMAGPELAPGPARLSRIPTLGVCVAGRGWNEDLCNQNVTRKPWKWKWVKNRTGGGTGGTGGADLATTNRKVTVFRLSLMQLSTLGRDVAFWISQVF